MLIHNEQDARFHNKERIVFAKKIYTVSGLQPPSKPDGKWSIRIEEEICSDSPLRLCKCFSPPEGSPCMKDEVYEWAYCIDGKVIFLDSGETWSEGDFEFFKYFSILAGWP